MIAAAAIVPWTIRTRDGSEARVAQTAFKEPPLYPFFPNSAMAVPVSLQCANGNKIDVLTERVHNEVSGSKKTKFSSWFPNVFWLEDSYMSEIILYHETPDKKVVPTFGLGDDKHDYGKGFYLTKDFKLAKEWAVCRPNATNGWVHTFVLDIDGLKVLDFQKISVLAWLAELMKHRDASDSKRYHVLAEKAYSQLTEDEDMLTTVLYDEFNAKYNGCL